MKLTDEELALVSALANKQVNLENEYAAAEDALKELKQQLDFIKQVELPNALAEIGLSSFTLTNGERVEVKQKYYASIPVESKSEAFAWLTDHNFDAIIKNTVKCDFGKGEMALAKSAMQELTSLGFRPQQDMGVHPMTLKAFVKDLFERGVEFPLELFGAGSVNESKVTLPKK
jgi:hypothetical protein